MTWQMPGEYESRRHFGGGSSPGNPPAPPPPPTKTDAEIQAERARTRSSIVRRKGRQSTILAGELGDTTAPDAKKLLGD